MGEGRAGRTGNISDASFDTLSQAQNTTNRRLKKLEDEVRRGRARLLSGISPGSPFVINEVAHKKGVRTTVRIVFPPVTDVDWVRMVYRPTADPNSKNKEQEWRDVTAAEAAAGQIERELKEKLDFNTAYGLVALMIKGDFVNSRRLRSPDPPSETTFLTTWTSMQAFDVPSAPSLGNIIENDLDLVTKNFDAFLVVQVIAPATSQVNATGTVSITANSATITGTGTSFLTQLAVGRGVRINGETHIVTGITNNTSATVDFAWKQSLSGQTLAVLTLQTWGEANIVRVVPKFQYVDDGNGRPITQPHEITSDESAQTDIKIRISGFLAARKYRWRRNIARSATGERDNSPASNVDFIAGGFTDATTGLPELTSLAYQYLTTEDYKNNERHVQVVATQPNKPIALDRAEFRKFIKLTGTVSVTNGSATITGSGTDFLTSLAAGHQVIIGAQTLTIQSVTNNTSATATTNSTATASGQTCYRSKRINQEKNLARMKFHPATGGQIVIEWGDIKTKKLEQHTFRTTIFSQNGFSRNLDDNFTTTADGSVDNDTAVSTTPAAPDVQEYFGALIVEADGWTVDPPLNVHTLSKFQFVMSTQNTAPAGDPTVGLEGVEKIKKSRGAVTFKRKAADISTTTFYFYVRAKNDIGWSAWSAGTSVLGSTINRPLTDVIGSGVPTLPIALERSNTGGTSGNSTTTYVLDAGASAADDFYIGMHLHIPSLAAANRIRRITDYVASTKTVTVDVAWSVTPGNSLAFEIHRGLEVGEKSGTATGVTTTIVLGSSASSADDAYTGMTIYLPASAAADQIRKITDYVGATKTATLESALSVATSSNDCYAISKGSFGYAAINPLSGIIAGVPFRLWYDDQQDANVIEVINPTGENAYSINAVNILGYRKSNGALKNDVTQNANVKPSYLVNAPSAYIPIFRIRLQNLYREGGSTGWSDYTYYVEGYQSGSTANYDPGAFVPVEIDLFDPDNFPISRYPAF